MPRGPFLVTVVLQILYTNKQAAAGSMTLRYQVDPGEPLTFMDVKVGKQVGIQIIAKAL